jgi:uncharacterized membrane protein
MRALLGLITALYPVVLYIGYRTEYYLVSIAVAAACFVVRGYGLTQQYARHRLQRVLIVSAVIAAIAAGCVVLGARAPLFWPVAVNLVLCGVFTASCWTSQNAIERLATAMEGPIPPQAKSYCTRVNSLWIAFFAVNAGLAFDSAFRSLEWWTLYNGVISYCAIGVLLLGEYVVRRKVKSRIVQLSQVVCLGAVSILWCGGITIAHSEQGAAEGPLQLEQLRERLSPPGPFRAEFTEKRFVAVLSQPLESRGSMRCIPDLGLQWEVAVPVARTTIITPKAIAQVVGQRTVHTTSDATNISQTMLSLLSGTLETVGRHFDLALVGDTVAWELRLTPRDSLVREVVSSVVVGGGMRPQRVEVHHASGDRVVTTFSEPGPLTPAEVEALKEALKRVA